MRNFDWVDATSVEHAATLLVDGGGRTVAKAGGLDLLDLMKEGVLKPSRLVNLKSIDALHGIRMDAYQGLYLGALTTLAEIAAHPLIDERYAALSAAASHAATPQIRNVATLGGNLLQRPRCWYFRNELLHRSSGDVQASLGEYQYHAIFDNANNAMVHASTPATALIAYGAIVHLQGMQGRTRAVALEDLLLPPDAARDRDAAIDRDEILTHIIVPPTLPGTRAAYSKQTERDSYDWPICDVAVALTLNERVIKAASIVVGSVAPTPMRASVAEALLKGQEMNAELASEAARKVVARATPFPSNAYKVPVLEAVLRRTLLAAAG